MSEKRFLAELSAEQLQTVNMIRDWIDEFETGIKTSMGEIMGAPFLKLNVEGKFKYGFTRGKHLTFHNWAMYCHPEIRETYASKLGVPKSRVQKSCINLGPRDQLNESAFCAMFQAGTGVDFADF